MSIMKFLSTFLIACLLSAGGVFALPLASPNADAFSITPGGVNSPSSGDGVGNGPSSSSGQPGGAGGAGTGLLGIGGDGGSPLTAPVNLCLGLSVCDPIAADGSENSENA